MLSTEIVTIIHLTDIPYGISSVNGENHTTGISMRTVPTHVGAATRHNRGTKSMPKVQKPVLEHPTAEARNQGSQEPFWKLTTVPGRATI